MRSTPSNVGLVEHTEEPLDEVEYICIASRSALGRDRICRAQSAARCEQRAGIQHEFAVKLPPCIPPRCAPMTQVVVAFRQPLCKVSQLMLAKQADRTRQANLHPAVHQ